MTIQEKLDRLDKSLISLNPLMIAFSGGVDSTFLLYRASMIPEIEVTAVSVKTPYIQSREITEAEEFCKSRNIEHIVINVAIPETVKKNTPDRCYYCKKHLFSQIIEIASKSGYKSVADGSNADDPGSYRPGLKALAELSVKSPLLEAGITKAEIREELKKYGLAIWDRPSMTCLLTRLPYNSSITEAELKMLEDAENFLFEKGFYGTRVRKHGEIARIECLPGYIERFVNSPERNSIVKKLKELGFRYISLDLEGYRSGSMDNI